VLDNLFVCLTVECLYSKAVILVLHLVIETKLSLWYSRIERDKQMDGTKEMGGLRNVSSVCSISEMDDFDLSRLLDKPKLNIERQRSFDERSLSELSIGLARGIDTFETTYSPVGRSGFNTPASSTRNSFEPHPMVADAWEALRRSLVYFRGQPVGTIAAYDHASEEVLNYDQVNIFLTSFCGIASFLCDKWNIRHWDVSSWFDLCPMVDILRDLKRVWQCGCGCFSNNFSCQNTCQ